MRISFILSSVTRSPLFENVVAAFFRSFISQQYLSEVKFWQTAGEALLLALQRVCPVREAGKVVVVHALGGVYQKFTRSLPPDYAQRAK